MERGYQLSLQGQNLAKKARKLKGWTVDDYKWLLEASKIVQPSEDWSQDKDYYAHNISEGTWKRFLYGKTVNYIAFKTYCEMLSLEVEDVIEKNRFDWFEGLSPKERRAIKASVSQEDDINKRSLILAQSFLDREMRRVFELNDIPQYRYWKFLEEVAWSMRRLNSHCLSYIDIMEIAENYFSVQTLETKFPFSGIQSMHEEAICGVKIFKLRDHAISDYIIAKNLVSDIRKDNLWSLSRLQTSYYEDIFIAKLIEQEANDPHLLEVIKNHYGTGFSKLLSVNSIGILSKISSINENNLLQPLIDFIFANNDVMELYSFAVRQRVLGSNSKKNTTLSNKNLLKLQKEIEIGYDPIAKIFCLNMLASEEEYPKLLKMLSSKYNGLLF